MKTYLIIFALLFIISEAQFNKSPNQNFYTGQSYGTVTKISPNNDYIIVGFRSGNLAIYKTNGEYYLSKYGYHSNQIVKILWPKGYGPVTIDRNGVAIRWTNSFSFYNTWTLGGQILGATFTPQSFGYIAFNLGNRIVQYFFDSTTVSNLYNAPIGQNYTALQYSTGRSYLYTGLTNGTGIVYNAQFGTQFYRFTTYYPLKNIELIDNQYLAIGLDSNDYFYQINYYGVVSYQGSSSSTQNFHYCQSSDYYVVSLKYFSQVDVYQKNNGIFKQYLDYFNYPAKGIDCNSQYLVTIDDNGYLTINTYAGFPGWAIGLIVGVVVIIIVVVIVIIIVRRKKMKRMAQGINGYNNMDNSSSNPYLHQTSANTGIQRGNNQGFNNTAVNNPYNIQNQGQIGGYSNQQYNPYQANQPRNWN